MLLEVDHPISPMDIYIEVKGEKQNNVVSLDTSTGRARVWEKDVNSYGTEWCIVERVFPVEDLHVYLVKPS